MIEWFARNPVAANLLMVGIVLAGLISAFTSISVESFPESEPDKVVITTTFRGATPKSTEDGITLRIEESISDIEGIKEILSTSEEGLSTVTVEVAESYKTRDLLDDIKVRVDALNTLPVDAENPIVALSSRSRQVLYVVVSGDVSDRALRDTAESFRKGLLTKKNITDVKLQGVANYEIGIEVSPANLDNYNLTLEQIGQAIRAGATDVSAGNVQTRDGDILLRSDGQAYTAAEFARIPIIPNALGKPITLGEIATIIDGFEESSIITKFEGEKALLVAVNRVGSQSELQVEAQTQEYLEKFSQQLPSNIELNLWGNNAAYLGTRIDAVLSSAVYGAILVILLLSLFLRPSVAFWVFLGIPVSFMGAFLFMPVVNGSFNVISLFAFIMVIGIVVDDAIVTGENIYRKLREGLDPIDASIVGTQEIATPVTFGILTTVVAFIPLNFLDGTFFDYISRQLPMVVIPILLMSLVESKLVLPSHMSHVKIRDPNAPMSSFTRFQTKISRGLERFVENHYRPFLARRLANKSITLAVLLAVASITVSTLYFGHLKFTPFPRVEARTVIISLAMPESTGFKTTDKNVQHIASQFAKLQEKYRDPKTGNSVIKNIYSSSGSDRFSVKPNVGSVWAELQDPTERAFNVTANSLGREVRELIGDIPGAQSLSVRASFSRSGSPVNIELSGDESARLFELAKVIKTQLRTYPGIFDLQDNYSGGKEELELILKPRAYSLGLRLDDVATQVRNAVFGFQAQRIQRGRDELRVMVRYPLEYRSSIEDLNRLSISVPNNGEEVLLSEVAEINPTESPSTLYRVDQRSVINVTADVDQDIANLNLILPDLKQWLLKVQQGFPSVNVRFDGEAENVRETNAKLGIGVLMVLMGIYALLAIPFKSYGQPLIVMSIIPFAIIGAMVGHLITMQGLSIISVFGMLALIGVVVNDSLVLVDYINKARAKGMALTEAVLESAAKRFRPVILTSITTFAGLAPVLLDGSQQAKWLKPMATSLAFGIVFATAITLIIIPVNYVVARNFKHAILDYWNRPDPQPEL